MRMRSFIFALFAAAGSALFLVCTNLGGGGTEWEAKITGRAVYEGSGLPVAGARVTVCEERFLKDTFEVSGDTLRQTLWETETDKSGCFSIGGLKPGTFHVEINSGQSWASLETCEILEYHSRISIESAIKPTGRISGTLAFPAGYRGSAFVQVYGLDRIARAAPGGSFELSDIPEGAYMVRVFAAQPEYLPKDVEPVPVTAGEGIDLGAVALPLNSDAWSHHLRIILNTTSAGASVAATVRHFPVLIRLTENNFSFDQAQPGGEDIRFTAAGDMPLPYEIERWDATVRRAELWVRVDTVFGNNDSQSVIMHWGNPDAAGISNSAAVFDTADDVAAVWHLDAVCLDASGNHHDGSAIGTRDTIGTIGRCRKFNGADSIVIPGLLGTPSSLTLCAWAQLDSTRPDCGGEILSIGDAVLLRMDYSINNIGTGGAVHMSDNEVFNHLGSGRFLRQSGWHHIAMTHDAAAFKTTLYIDGIRVGERIEPGRPINYAGLGQNTCIGKHGNGKPGFEFMGRIDEARVYRTALPDEYIKLCFMNQSISDRLVVFK